MARINPPGVTEVVWVTTITVPGAPTAANINAGVDLTGSVRGIPSVPETGNMADTADLSSKFNKRIPASYGGDNITLEFYSDDDGTDLAYVTVPRSTAGYWCIGWQGIASSTGVWATSDLVWVYPCTITTRGMGSPGRDEALWFVSEGAITTTPTERYSIAT